MNTFALVVGYVILGIISLGFAYGIIMALIRHFANSSYMEGTLDDIFNRLAIIERKLENKEKE